MVLWLGEWPYASRTFKGAVYLFATVFLFVTVAFSTPYWLVSVPSEMLPSPKFTNLGKIIYAYLNCARVIISPQ